jgi:hypothetical protein
MEEYLRVREADLKTDETCNAHEYMDVDDDGRLLSVGRR